MRIILLVAALLIPAMMQAQISSFQSVKFERVSREDGKVKKADGMIHLDRGARVISFSSDNRVLCSIRYEDINSMTYEANDHWLDVRFSESGAGDVARFRLDGGNRNDILSRIEAQTMKSITRVKK